MAIPSENLTPFSSFCGRGQNCCLIFRPTCRFAINGMKQCKFQCKIYCSMKNRHGGHFKKYTREPFRTSTMEDALITSWALYNHDDVKKKPISTIPTTHNFEKPEATADDQHANNFVADAQGRKGRRNSRVGNPSLSLSQSFDGQTNGGYIIEATGAPAALSKPFAGGAGLYMAMVFALLGITTAGASLLGMNSSHSQEECTKCSGYGVERCHLCQCTGTIECEFDPDDVHVIACPLCFGSLVEKCSNCHGVRTKKGVPPFLQQEKVRSSKRRKK